MKDSALRTKIQTKLAELSFGISPVALAKLRIASNKGGLDATVYAGQEWQATKFYYSVKKQDCELCGHANLMRVFVIKSQTSGKELHIGSECVRNYLSDDIVAGICKLFDLEYNKIVNPVKYEDAMTALRWAYENRMELRTYRFGGARNILVNYGDPTSVLRKIETGKPIAKAERAVMDFWNGVYAKRENIAWDEFADAVKAKVASDARAAAREASMRMYNFASFFWNIENDYNTVNRLALFEMVNKVFDFFVSETPVAKVETNVVEVVTPARTVKMGFNVAYKMNLEYPRKKFLNGLYAAYKNYGYLTAAQEEALYKLAGI